MLKSINDEPDPVLKLELEAGLHTWQAQWCIKRAAQMELYAKGYIRKRTQ
jgi:hypothetical protein